MFNALPLVNLLFSFSSVDLVPVFLCPEDRRFVLVVAGWLIFFFDSNRFCCFDARQKREREKVVPDAMYKNRYASGLAGSDAPSVNPLPPTTSHNQPHSRIRSGTITTAALQNHRDHPHLAGNEACLCSSCHIRDRFFPRSQDGRIVLPHPSLSVHSGRLPRPTTTSMASATPPHATPSLVTRKRSRTESTVPNRDRE